MLFVTFLMLLAHFILQALAQNMKSVKPIIESMLVDEVRLLTSFVDPCFTSNAAESVCNAIPIRNPMKFHMPCSVTHPGLHNTAACPDSVRRTA